MPPISVASLGPATHPSPQPLADRPGCGVGQFVSDGTFVRDRIEVCPDRPEDEGLLFEKAGPRARLFFKPSEARAAIVTCGGLCPGLNNVIRSLFLELHFNYRVPIVLGIRFGFQGLNPREGQPPVPLTPDFVANIHRSGGTILGSSRGPQDPRVMVDYLQREGINLLFCVGGDGTQRGAHVLHEEAQVRGYPLAVVGIPKTIDNDILFCDRSFGVVTAIEKASEVVELAHNEARGVQRGIGLVKVMGRESGFIACGATLASQQVNYTLIPESPFRLSGEDGLLASLERRIDARNHAVIVVAEGAGQHLFPEDEDLGHDASGNRRYHDIGPFLKEQIQAHFHRMGRPVEIKYIDPSYIVRSLPANCDDSLLCDGLARRAVDAALAGKSDLMIGYLNGAFVHVPIAMAVAEKRKVSAEGMLWNAVLAATGQPPRLGAEAAVGRSL